MTDTTTLRQRLEQAQTARHKLLTGSMRERINSAGTEVTYTRADIGRLERYIAELQGELARAEGRPPRRTVMNTYY